MLGRRDERGVHPQHGGPPATMRCEHRLYMSGVETDPEFREIGDDVRGIGRRAFERPNVAGPQMGNFVR